MGSEMSPGEFPLEVTVSPLGTVEVGRFLESWTVASILVFRFPSPWNFAPSIAHYFPRAAFPRLGRLNREILPIATGNWSSWKIRHKAAMISVVEIRKPVGPGLISGI